MLYIIHKITLEANTSIGKSQFFLTVKESVGVITDTASLLYFNICKYSKLNI